MAVATKWTGGTTVAPFTGELSVMLCARATVVRTAAATAQRTKFLKVDVRAACASELSNARRDNDWGKNDWKRSEHRREI